MRKEDTDGLEDASSCASDDIAALDSDDESAEFEPFDGPWLLNAVSGWYHKAVRLDDDAPSECGVLWQGKCWGRACRPQARGHLA